MGQIFIGAGNLQTNVLEPFGDEWAVYCALMWAGRAAGAVLVNEVRDKAKTRRAMTSIAYACRTPRAGCCGRNI